MEEVDIFVITENGKRYSIDVKKTITYGELMSLLDENIFYSGNFVVTFNGKQYGKKNKKEILNFNKGDIIYTMLTVVDECHCNVAFHLNVNVDEADKSVVPLSGILQLCLLKYIAKRIDNNAINKISSTEIKSIIVDLKKEMDLSDDPQKDIKTNLSQKTGNNIITYINYIKRIIKKKRNRPIN